jgi:hypothetical protein
MMLMLMKSQQRFGPFHAWTSLEYWQPRQPASRVFWAQPFLSFFVASSWESGVEENAVVVW